MIRTTLIFAAALASSGASAFYRMKDPSLACTTVEALREGVKAIHEAPTAEDAVPHLERITRDGECVMLAGNYIIIEEKTGPLVKFTTSSDPRTLYTFVFFVDWNQR